MSWDTKPVQMRFVQPGITMILTDAVEIELNGRWSWLRRAAFGLLKKLGAVEPYFSKQDIYEHVVCFDANEAIDRIIVGASVELKRLGRMAERVLLGPREFADLMHRAPFPAFMPQLNFTGMAMYDGEIYGLKVEVIPHMTGVLVL